MLFSKDELASVKPDNKRLHRFRNIILESSETKTVKFVIYPRDLAIFTHFNKLIIEKGDFTLKISNLHKALEVIENVRFQPENMIQL
jgi:hypothetical protein